MPSFTAINESIGDILSLNATGEIVFPVDVSYDFERREWIEKQNGVEKVVELPWVSEQSGETYPILNDLLIESSTLSLGYTTVSSTACSTSKPQTTQNPNCALGFYCAEPRLKKLSQLQAPATYADAVVKCADDFGGGFILTQTMKQIIERNQKMKKSFYSKHLNDRVKLESFLWTGSTRHNASHFRREDGVLFEPNGFAGTYRGFPATVLIRVTPDGTLEARNSLGDAYNWADSDYCLCHWNVATLTRLFNHKYVVVYVVSIIIAFICILIYCVFHLNS